LSEDGITYTSTDLSPALALLERYLAKEAQLATASGRVDVRESTFLPPFPQDVEVIDATETGRLLGLSDRQVRRLGAELGGRKVILKAPTPSTNDQHVNRVLLTHAHLRRPPQSISQRVQLYNVDKAVKTHVRQ